MAASISSQQPAKLTLLQVVRLALRRHHYSDRTGRAIFTGFAALCAFTTVIPDEPVTTDNGVRDMLHSRS